MRQGRASRDVTEGQKMEPKSFSTNPGYVGQLGNKQGSHVTSHDDTSYRGDPFHIGRGFKAPPVKSQSRNRGSQGRY
jgi:hypothetical protein